MAHRAYQHPDYVAFKLALMVAIDNAEPIACVMPERYPSLDPLRCQRVATSPNHIVPVLAGGSWREHNLEPSCQRCNLTLAAQSTKRTKRIKYGLVRGRDY